MRSHLFKVSRESQWCLMNLYFHISPIFYAVGIFKSFVIEFVRFWHVEIASEMLEIWLLMSLWWYCKLIKGNDNQKLMRKILFSKRQCKTIGVSIRIEHIIMGSFWRLGMTMHVCSCSDILIYKQHWVPSQQIFNAVSHLQVEMLIECIYEEIFHIPSTRRLSQHFIWLFWKQCIFS